MLREFEVIDRPYKIPTAELMETVPGHVGLFFCLVAAAVVFV